MELSIDGSTVVDMTSFIFLVSIKVQWENMTARHSGKLEGAAPLSHQEQSVRSS